MKRHLDKTFLARWMNEDLSKEEELYFRKSSEYAEFKKIADLSRKLKIPDFEKTKIFDEIQDKKGDKIKVKPLFSNWLYKIAAIVIALFGIFHLLKPSITEYKSKIGEQLTFSLPDNSKVTLNSNSSLTFYTKNWDKNKEITLNGEAFFDVTKGSLFSVKTTNATVQVLGTRFNVKSQNKYFETQCYHGKVKILGKKVDEVVLSLGKAYRIENNLANHRNLIEEKPSWLDGESTFKDVPLEQVLAALKNQFGITLSYQKEKYATARFTGSFIHNDLNTSLQMVFSAMEIKYIKEGNVITLK